jgi:hypothetical protein
MHLIELRLLHPQICPPTIREDLHTASKKKKSKIECNSSVQCQVKKEFEGQKEYATTPPANISYTTSQAEAPESSRTKGCVY